MGATLGAVMPAASFWGVIPCGLSVAQRFDLFSVGI